MSRRQNDVLSGTLNLLVLKTLKSRGSLHGYGIATQLLAASPELRIEEGSLYPALHRMEQDGWISASWGTSDLGRRARIYAITPLGQKQLAAEERRWSELTAAVGRALRFV